MGFHPSKYHNLLRSFFADQSIFRLYQMKSWGCSNQFPLRQKGKKGLLILQKKKTSEDIILLLSTSFRGELPQDIADYLLPPAEKHLIFDTTLRVNLL